MAIDVRNNVFQNLGNTPALNLPPGETLNLFANAGIFATGLGAGSHGVLAAAAGNTMNIFGDVYSREAKGIRADAGNHIISIAATGSVYGLEGGIELAAGGNTITNDGQISAASGVALRVLGAGNQVVNRGSIQSGEGFGVSLAGTGQVFTNHGTVEAGLGGVGVILGGQLVNTGTIQAGTGVALSQSSTLLNGGTIVGLNLTAVNGSTQLDTITNNGLLQGSGGIAVALVEGADTYDGRGGRVIGQVQGGSGNDTLLGGAFVDHLVGGNQDDTLTGGGAADTLDGGAGNDNFMLNADASIDTMIDASGTDTVFSAITRSIAPWAFIENMILQGAGNINGTANNGHNGVIGNGVNNILAGQGGNDTLLGGGGNDFLFGQLGKDSLRGDAGDDRFVLQSVNDSPTGVALRDTILDFDDAGDDLIDLTAIPGLAPGSFIGAAAFTGINQVRIQQVGADVLVQVNTAGDTTPEAEMLLANTTIGGGVGQVNGADFLL